MMDDLGFINVELDPDWEIEIDTSDLLGLSYNMKVLGLEKSVDGSVHHQTVPLEVLDLINATPTNGQITFVESNKFTLDIIQALSECILQQNGMFVRSGTPQYTYREGKCTMHDSAFFWMERDVNVCYLLSIDATAHGTRKQWKIKLVDC